MLYQKIISLFPKFLRLKTVFSNFLHSKRAFLNNCKNTFLKQNETYLKGRTKTIIIMLEKVSTSCFYNSKRWALAFTILGVVKDYDGLIILSSCRMATLLSTVISNRTTVLITRFPCKVCHEDHALYTNINLSLFPSCDAIADMIYDVATIANWTTSTVVMKDLSRKFDLMLVGTHINYRLLRHIIFKLSFSLYTYYLEWVCLISLVWDLSICEKRVASENV